MVVRIGGVSGLVLAAMLAGCATPGGDGAGTPAANAAAANVYAGRSVVDVAITSAGGADALARVKELAWSGTTSTTTDGKTAAIGMQTVVRPGGYAEITSWPAATAKPDPKTLRTLRVEGAQAYNIHGAIWDPLTDAQRVVEAAQFDVYRMMLLTQLKDPAAKISELPAKDGLRTLHVEGLAAPPTDLSFDAAGKLVRASLSVRDPAGGAAPVAETMEFTGELASNGVKWPKHISVKRNGAPYAETELTTFEARPAIVPVTLPQTLYYGAYGAPTNPPSEAN